jgi:hypothetical protein
MRAQSFSLLEAIGWLRGASRLNPKLSQLAGRDKKRNVTGWLVSNWATGGDFGTESAQLSNPKKVGSTNGQTWGQKSSSTLGLFLICGYMISWIVGQMLARLFSCLM